MFIKIDSLSPQHNDHYTSNEFSPTRIQTTTQYGTCSIAQHSCRNEGNKLDIPSDTIQLCHKIKDSITKSIVPETIADNIPSEMLLNNIHDTSFSSTTTSMQASKHLPTNLNSPFKKQSSLHRTNSFSTNKSYLEQQKKVKKKSILNDSMCFSGACDGPSSHKHHNNHITNQTTTATSNNETRLTIKISKLKDGLRTISFNNNNTTFNQKSDTKDLCNKDVEDSNADGGVCEDDADGGDNNDGGQTDSDETEEEVYVGDLFIHNENHINVTQNNTVQNISTQSNQLKDNASATIIAIKNTIPSDSSTFSHSSISNSVDKHSNKNKQTNSCNKNRPIRINKSNNKSKYKGNPKARSQKTRSVSVNTEDDLLGVCEAGTVVRMPGYVWTDSAQNGMLLFKTVWKNKRYEGMLVQASHDDWSFPKSRVFTSCPGSRYKRRCKKPKEFSYVDNCKKRSRNMKSKNRALRNLLGLDDFSSCGNSSDDMALHEPEEYLSCSESGCEKKFACVLARQFHHDQCHAVYDDYVLEKRKKEKDEEDEEEGICGEEEDDRFDINGGMCEKINKKRVNEEMTESSDGMNKKEDSMMMKKLKLSNSNADFEINDSSSSSSGESSITAKSSLFATSLNPTLMLIRRHKNNCYDDLQTSNPPPSTVSNSSNHPLCSLSSSSHSLTLSQDSTSFSHSICSPSINASTSSINLSFSLNSPITQFSSTASSIFSIVPPIWASPSKNSTIKTSQTNKSKQATSSTKSLSQPSLSSSSSLLSSSSSSPSPLVASSIVYQLLSNNYTSLHSQQSSVQLSSSLSSSPSLLSPSFPQNTEAFISTSIKKNNISTKTVETQHHNTPLLSSFTDSLSQHLSSNLNKQQLIANTHSSFIDSPLIPSPTDQASSSSTNQTPSSSTNQMPVSSDQVTALSSNQECSLSNKTSSSSPSVKAESSPISSTKSSSSSSLSLMIDEGVKSPSQQTIRNTDDTPSSQDDTTPSIENIAPFEDKDLKVVCEHHQDSSTEVMKYDGLKEGEKEEDVRKDEGVVEEKKKKDEDEKGDGEVSKEGASPVYSDISDAVEDTWQEREAADEENRVADWLQQSDNMQYTSYFQQIILNKHFTPYKQSPPNHSILPPENPS